MKTIHSCVWLEFARRNHCSENLVQLLRIMANVHLFVDVFKLQFTTNGSDFETISRLEILQETP